MVHGVAPASTHQWGLRNLPVSRLGASRLEERGDGAVLFYFSNAL
jgi:hypothetical protein